MKKCRDCNKEKPIEEFHKNSTYDDGRLPMCRLCRAKSRRTRKNKNAKVKEYNIKLSLLEKKELAKEGKKLCTRCNTIKDISEYHKRKGKLAGVRTYCKSCNRKYLREWSLKKKYGVKLEHYQKQYDNQKGECYICNEPKEVLHVDHCHKTNIVRKLLCDRCNLILGSINEDIEILQNMIDYIKKYEI